MGVPDTVGTMPFDFSPEDDTAPLDRQTRDAMLTASLDSIRGRFGFKAITLAASVKRPEVDSSDNLVE